MTSIAGSTVIALGIALLIGGIWMAVWAWRNFRVSVFAWLVIGVIAHRIAVPLTVLPDRARIESAVKTLQSHTDLPPEEVLISMIAIGHLFPLLSTLGFGLVALGELAHLGPRVVPPYKPQAILKIAYHFRHVSGLFGVVCTIAPSIALYFWARSMR